MHYWLRFDNFFMNLSIVLGIRQKFLIWKLKDCSFLLASFVYKRLVFWHFLVKIGTIRFEGPCFDQRYNLFILSRCVGIEIDGNCSELWSKALNESHLVHLSYLVFKCCFLLNLTLINQYKLRLEIIMMIMENKLQFVNRFVISRISLFDMINIREINFWNTKKILYYLCFVSFRECQKFRQLVYLVFYMINFVNSIENEISFWRIFLIVIFFVEGITESWFLNSVFPSTKNCVILLSSWKNTRKMTVIKTLMASIRYTRIYFWKLSFHLPGSSKYGTTKVTRIWNISFLGSRT